MMSWTVRQVFGAFARVELEIVLIEVWVEELDDVFRESVSCYRRLGTVVLAG
jgi:hypothetical protein